MSYFITKLDNTPPDIQVFWELQQLVVEQGEGHPSGHHYQHGQDHHHQGASRIPAHRVTLLGDNQVNPF